jgi:hypothetical protein
MDKMQEIIESMRSLKTQTSAAWPSSSCFSGRSRKTYTTSLPYFHNSTIKLSKNVNGWADPAQSVRWQKVDNLGP